MPWKIKDENSYPPDNLYVDAKEAFEVFGNDLCDREWFKFSGAEACFRCIKHELIGGRIFAYQFNVPLNKIRVAALEYIIYLKYEE